MKFSMTELFQFALTSVADSAAPTDRFSMPYALDAAKSPSAPSPPHHISPQRTVATRQRQTRHNPPFAYVHPAQAVLPPGRCSGHLHQVRRGDQLPVEVVRPGVVHAAEGALDRALLVGAQQGARCRQTLRKARAPAVGRPGHQHALPATCTVGRRPGCRRPSRGRRRTTSVSIDLFLLRRRPPGRFVRSPGSVGSSDGWFCVVRGSDVGTPGRLPDGASGPGERAGDPVFRRRRARLPQRLPAPGRPAVRRRAGLGQAHFRCMYHAWSYDLDGKLVAAPNLVKMPDIDRVEYGLRRVHVTRMLGYVWVCLASSPPSLRHVMGRARSGSATSPPSSATASRTCRWGGGSATTSGELETRHRELHGVLPLRDHPPRVGARAARVRRRLRGQSFVGHGASSAPGCKASPWTAAPG